MFEAEEIEDFETLRCMTADDFQDVGLPLGPRLKLLKAISQLKTPG